MKLEIVQIENYAKQLDWPLWLNGVILVTRQIIPIGYNTRVVVGDLSNMRNCQSPVSISQWASLLRPSVQEMLAHLKTMYWNFLENVMIYTDLHTWASLYQTNPKSPRHVSLLPPPPLPWWLWGVSFPCSHHHWLWPNRYHYNVNQCRSLLNSGKCLELYTLQ